MDDASAGPFRRNGSYVLQGDWLVSPVLNEGQPVHVALRDGRLALTINDALAFRLRRE